MCPVQTVTYVSGRSVQDIQQLHAAFISATGTGFCCEGSDIEEHLITQSS
jgi:hypothetical protein